MSVRWWIWLGYIHTYIYIYIIIYIYIYIYSSLATYVLRDLVPMHWWGSLILNVGIPIYWDPYLDLKIRHTIILLKVYFVDFRLGTGLASSSLPFLFMQCLGLYSQFEWSQLSTTYCLGLCHYHWAPWSTVCTDCSVIHKRLMGFSSTIYVWYVGHK